VNRIADGDVAIDDLVADPVEAAHAIQRSARRTTRSPAPRDLYAPESASTRAGSIFSDEDASTHSPTD